MTDLPDRSDRQQHPHPREERDRPIVKRLLEVKSLSENLNSEAELDLVELARLIIRYRGFPGAKEIRDGLKKVLENWQLTEEQLFERTRRIHAAAQVYKRADSQAEDWS